MSSAPEVVVVGAGAAGLAAAISAARRNVRVALLERRPALGGIVTHALIHTIAGLYDADGCPINAGLPVELEERLLRLDPQTRKRKMGRVWVLSASPSVYAAAIEAWIGEEPNIQVFRESDLTAVGTAQNRVEALTFTQFGEPRTIRPRALIDCTGTADAIRSIDPQLVYQDKEQALAGLIFRIGGVRSDDVVFPRGLVIQRALKDAVNAGALPPECANAWIDVGVGENEVYLKLSVTVGFDAAGRPPTPTSEIREKLMAFLATLPAFADAVLFQTGDVSLRGGDRARGDYQLTIEDVRDLRRFPDAACRCAWPIEYWDPAKGVALEYLKDGGYYDIPLRSLKVAGFENVWAAGKCLSSDHLAQASARVSGCCWAMGEAAGNAVIEA